MKKITNTIKLSLVAALGIMLFSACQKMDRPALGDYPKDDAVLPGGDLRFYLPFDSVSQAGRVNAKDSISGFSPLSYNLTAITGVSGQGIKGKDGSANKYFSANDFKNATSFTVAFWMKNPAQAGRTEFLFSYVDDSYGWGHSSMFLLLENQTATQTTMKFGLMDQWLEGTLVKPLFDGQWHHLAYVYDQTTSKMTYYFDGALVTGMNSTQTDVKKNGAPRGAVDFTTSKSFVLGGWNKHANVEGPTDDWVSSYTGSLDQFRLYNKAISAAEINALYTGRK